MYGGKATEGKKQSERGPVKEPEAERPDVLSAVLLREVERKGRSMMEKRRPQMKRGLRSCCMEHKHKIKVKANTINWM